MDLELASVCLKIKWKSFFPYTFTNLTIFHNDRKWNFQKFIRGNTYRNIADFQVEQLNRKYQNIYLTKVENHLLLK